jgi:arginyl-tRNA synthetase
MKEQIKSSISTAVKALKLGPTDEEMRKVTVEYTDPQFGDFSSNAALILAKSAKQNPRQLAEQIVKKIDDVTYEKIEVAGPGFINFRIKNGHLISETLLVAKKGPKKSSKKKGRIVLDYFQPNIAKPMHIGLLRTAIIGDCIKRILLYEGCKAESDTHMGDWGTQFGLLLLAFKKYGDLKVVEKDPINELNKLYIQINKETENNPELHEEGKREFAKLEQGDKENRKIWQQFVDWSMEKFLKINDLMDILPFDHHWPESSYEDKMPKVLERLKKEKLLVESQGAQVVDLEKQHLGTALLVKSDGSTTYLLRDLAAFLFRKNKGFDQQLYIVDNRQSHSFDQLFAILKLLNEIKDGEGVHIDYGFISFGGSALSTRKGNMVLAEDVVAQSKEKVAKIIEEKNPDLKNKEVVVRAVAIAALKYFDLSHNRHSDIEFNWDEALNFEGNSGPYLQYAYARLSSILRKTKISPPREGELEGVGISETERQIMVELLKWPEKVEEVMGDYMPNVLVTYLFDLSNLLNRFYHESPVLKEPDEEKKQLRLNLAQAAKNTLGEGLKLLGITPLEEM